MKKVLCILIVLLIVFGCVDVGDKTATNYTVQDLTTPGYSGIDFSGNFSITNTGGIPGSGSITWNLFISESPVLNATSARIDFGSVSGLPGNGVSSTIDYSGQWKPINNTQYLIITVSASDDSDSTDNLIVNSGTTPAFQFVEDFEDGDISDWTVNASVTASVVDIPYSGVGTASLYASKAVRVESAVGGLVGITKPLEVPYTDTLTLEYLGYYICVDDFQGSRGYGILMAPGGVHFMFSCFRFANPQTTIVGNDTAAADGVTADHFVWYHIELKNINIPDNTTDQRTFDLYINGNFVKQCNATNTVSTAFRDIKLCNLTNSTTVSWYTGIVAY